MRLGARHAVAMNSGTAAIHAALEAIQIGPGDDVITTPFTFVATATPILMQRANVKFADIDARTFNVDSEAVSRAITAETRAAIAVDLFGLPAIVSQPSLYSRGVTLIEDACQAVGATLRGAAAGTLGRMAAFSFYATKNITAGEGGMLVTNDEDIAKCARRFREHGGREMGQYTVLGYNYRLTDIAAAIGRVQLSRLDALTAKRRRNAEFYDEHLGGIAGLATPYVPDGAKHVYHQYSILIDECQTPNGIGRDALFTFLAERSIEAGIYYPKPLHLQPLFSSAGYGRGDFPIAERVANQILSLPIHPSLSQVQLDAVVSGVRAAIGL